MGLPSHYSLCPSQLKHQMKTFWLKASVLYEQLLSSVLYTTTCPATQSINYFGQKLAFFFKFNTFQPLKLFFRDFSYQPTWIKGNPNSQGILNWIIQILHYYYRKQHKNIENSQIIKQNLVYSLSLSLCLPFSLFTIACASFAFLAAEFFSVL